VTSGPLVLLKVNGHEPGDEIRLPVGKHQIEVSAEVASINPIETIEIMHNGKPVAELKPEGTPNRAAWKKAVEVNGSGWISARVRAKYGRDPIRRPFPFAATMPVWVTVDGKPVRSKEDALYFIEWIDRTLDRAMKTGSFNNESEREEIRKLYAEAKEKMMQRAAEAER
jgi:hypothetical protein